MGITPYEIFHTRAVTRAGHFACMLGVNLFLMAGLARVPVAAATAGASGPLASPWLWMTASALLVALSHAAEPLRPPRVNQTRHWMPVSH